jgi:flagellar motor switch protein FliN
MADEKKIKSGESELESIESRAILNDTASSSLEQDQSKARKNTNTPTTSDLDFILDIPLEITVELGRTTMMINDLLKLGQGSVIELSKPAGDTLEILANNRLIAKGDVVVINDKYGIRLTEVTTPVERVEKLR